MDHATRDAQSADRSTATPPASQQSPPSYRHSLSVDAPLAAVDWLPAPVTPAEDVDHQDALSHNDANRRSRLSTEAGAALAVAPVSDVAHAGLLNARSDAAAAPPLPSRRASGKMKKQKPRAVALSAFSPELELSAESSSSASPTASAGGRQPSSQSTAVDAAAASSNSSSASLSALELRRKRNRESMQRTREREREEVGQMRQALVVMEKQYKRALLVQSQQQSDPVLSEYYSLSSESKQLKRENFLLRQNLERRRKAYERMERILADYHIEKSDVDVDMLEDEEAVNSASAVFGIAPITEDEAFALIARCSQAVERLEKTTANVSMESETRCFGWSVRRKVIGDSGVHFLFTKTYANLDPERAANRAWDIYKTSEKNNMKPIRVLRFETLQVVNENTMVMARDIVHPRHKGVVMRSIFLRFRMETDTGFVVGRSCMNPAPGAAQPGEHAGIRFADLTTWLEANYIDPQRRDQVGCEVKFGGYCDYKTTHDLHERFMDVLFSVLQLENRVLEPLVPLLT